MLENLGTLQGHHKYAKILSCVYLSTTIALCIATRVIGKPVFTIELFTKEKRYFFFDITTWWNNQGNYQEKKKEKFMNCLK